MAMPIVHYFIIDHYQYFSGASVLGWPKIMMNLYFLIPKWSVLYNCTLAVGCGVPLYAACTMHCTVLMQNAACTAWWIVSKNWPDISYAHAGRGGRGGWLPNVGIISSLVRWIHQILYTLPNILCTLPNILCTMIYKGFLRGNFGCWGCYIGFGWAGAHRILLSPLNT